MRNAIALVNEVWGVIWIAVVNKILKHKNRVIFKESVILEVFTLVQLNVWS